MTNFTTWLKGLAAALAGGAVASAAHALSATGPITGKSLGTAAATGAALTLAAYLTQSPTTPAKS